MATNTVSNDQESLTTTIEAVNPDEATAPVTPVTPVTSAPVANRRSLPPWAWLIIGVLLITIFALLVLALMNKASINGNVGNVPVAPISAAPFAANHILWSAYGTPSFIVTDGKSTESASDVFTDPTKGDLTLTIKPTEETCLLQYGITEIYTSQFSANFAANDTGAGFRVISQSYWETLPVSDGAYNLCWNR